MEIKSIPWPITAAELYWNAIIIAVHDGTICIHGQSMGTEGMCCLQRTHVFIISRVGIEYA